MDDLIFESFLYSPDGEYKYSYELIQMIKNKPSIPECIFVQINLCRLFNFRSEEFHDELSSIYSNLCIDDFTSKICRERFEWKFLIAPKMTNMEILHQYNPVENPNLFRRNMAYLFINRRCTKDIIKPYLLFQQKSRYSILDLCIRFLYTKTDTGFEISTKQDMYKLIQYFELSLFENPLVNDLYISFFANQDRYSLSDFIYSSVFCRLINVRNLIIKVYGTDTKEHKLCGILEDYLCGYFSEKIEGKLYINRYGYMLEMFNIMSGKQMSYIDRWTEKITNRTGTLIMSSFVDILGWNIKEKNLNEITKMLSRNMDMVYKLQIRNDRRGCSYLGHVINLYFTTSKSQRRDATWTMYYKLLLDFNNTFLTELSNRFAVFKKFLEEHKDCPICYESFKKNQHVFSCLSCKEGKVHLNCGRFLNGYRCCLCMRRCENKYLLKSFDRYDIKD